MLDSLKLSEIFSMLLAFTAGTPVRSPGSNLDLIKQAGAHDPFASLTGLPRGNTPGSAKPSPSKASPSISPNTSSGNLWA